MVFNAANEAAVEEFLAGTIKFVNIIELVEQCLDIHQLQKDLTLEQLLEIDSWARKQVKDAVRRKSRNIKI